MSQRIPPGMPLGSDSAKAEIITCLRDELDELRVLDDQISSPCYGTGDSDFPHWRRRSPISCVSRRCASGLTSQVKPLNALYI